MPLKLYDGMPEKVERMVFCGSLPKFAKSKDFPYGLNVNRMRMLAKQLEMGYPFIVDIFFRSLFTKEERKTRRYKWLQKFRKFNAKPMKKSFGQLFDGSRGSRFASCFATSGHSDSIYQWRWR